MGNPSQADLDDLSKPRNVPTSGRITHRVRLEKIMADMVAGISKDMTRGARIPTRRHPELNRGSIAHYGRIHAPNIVDYGQGIAVDQEDDFIVEDTGEFDSDELDDLQSDIDELTDSVDIEGQEQAESGSAGSRLTAFAPAPMTIPVLTRTVPVINSPMIGPAAALNPGVAIAIGVAAAAAYALQLATQQSPRSIPRSTTIRRRRRRCERCVALSVQIVQTVSETRIDRIVDDRCLETSDTAKRTRIKAYSRKP